MRDHGLSQNERGAGSPSLVLGKAPVSEAVFSNLFANRFSRNGRNDTGNRVSLADRLW
jgi:hypothetical protein